MPLKSGLPSAVRRIGLAAGAGAFDCASRFTTVSARLPHASTPNKTDFFIMRLLSALPGRIVARGEHVSSIGQRNLPAESIVRTVARAETLDHNLHARLDHISCDATPH